jgi:hypothetical protein
MREDTSRHSGSAPGARARATSPLRWIGGTSLAASAVTLAAILVASALCNVVFAMVRSREDPRLMNGGVRVSGPATGRGWPAAAPDGWPSPDVLDVTTTFGATVTDSFAGSGGAVTHAMEIREFGWPFPALRAVRLMTQTAAARSPTVTESGLAPAWSGLLLNPLLVGGLLWLTLAAPVSFLVWYRGWSRTVRGACGRCGYTVGNGRVCPECGRAVPARASAA